VANPNLQHYRGITRARGYRNTETFMTMIYLIASPAGKILEST
jgi:hypothetical protein